MSVNISPGSLMIRNSLYAEYGTLTMNTAAMTNTAAAGARIIEPTDATIPPVRRIPTARSQDDKK